MIGLPKLLIFFSRIKLSKSPEATLKAGTFILFKNSALSKSKGVDKNVIFFLSL